MVDAYTVIDQDYDESDYYLDEYDDEVDDWDKECGRSNHSNLLDKLDLTTKNQGKSGDKSDKRTKGDLDDRARRIILKMLSQETFKSIEGCMSAGKEASVFRAVRDDGDYALKVYATSNMQFKARREYMDGDFRMRNATYNNSTKLINKWAEKEHRNLQRICKTEGFIPCPTPIVQKSMVLLMTMIGEDGVGAPRLRDVLIDDDDVWQDLYMEVVAMVRVLFQECRLIHGDLSEYNLLYHQNKIWMIDVSQSVEHEHPKALFYLRRDCQVMNSFFRSRCRKTLLLKEFFDLVVDPAFGDHRSEDFMDRVRATVADGLYPSGLDDEAHFLGCEIPRKLSEVKSFNVDFKKALKNPESVANIPYAKLTGIDQILAETRANKQQMKRQHKINLKKKQNRIEDEEDEEDEDSDSNEEDAEEENEKKSCARPKNEDPETKKNRKKEVKEKQKERMAEKKINIIKQKMKSVPGYKKRYV